MTWLNSDEREWVDTMQVCLNGHKITGKASARPESRRDFCPRCGEKTIMACPACNASIPGYHHMPRVSYPDDAAPPRHCHHCGKPFPWASKTVEASAKPATIDYLAMVLWILERFHLVAKQLRERHSNRPTLDLSDEYDVQDLLHALLRIDFDDVRSEEWSPSYAGGASRMDFLLKAEQIVIEVKKTRSGLGAKEIGEQLIVDVARYRSHPECKNLICFIYDPDGRISNPRGLAVDLEKLSSDTLKVAVSIHP